MHYFVTGTDTDVGKTVASAWLTHHLNAKYWKPVQSGIVDYADKDVVATIADLSPERIIPSVYELNEPLSPHLAARLDGVRIDLDDINLPDVDGPLIVEGAGGVFVPLNDEALLIDLMVKIDLPVVVVARSGLGTINHTLLTLQALRTRGLKVAGVIMNGALNLENKKAIEIYGNVRVIAELPVFEQLDRNALDKITLPEYMFV